VSRARRLAALILLAVAMLTLAIVVLVLNRDVSADLLAALGIIGGVAIAVVALPVNGKNGKE
jgi:predicted neutral ceramidase superfamily lipid hydrolase